MPERDPEDGNPFGLVHTSVQPAGEPTEDELRAINSRHALKPLAASDVYVFRMEMSNDQTDSYHTYMDPETTLPNYVRDFADGRSIQNSHRVTELPLARSFDAFLEERGVPGDPTNPKRTAAIVKGYVVRGLKLTDVATDDLIRGIDAGIVKDASVRFDNDARYVCDLCNDDMYERASTCMHLPGMSYEGKRARAKIVDGRAIEGSLVFDGSTPRAMVEKARALAEDGKLDQRQVRKVEQLYRIRINSATAGRLANEVMNATETSPGRQQEEGMAPPANEHDHEHTHADGTKHTHGHAHAGDVHAVPDDNETAAHTHGHGRAQQGDEPDLDDINAGFAPDGDDDDRKGRGRSVLDRVDPHVRTTALFIGAPECERAVADSYEDIQRQLSLAIDAELIDDDDSWSWVVATTATDVTYEVHGDKAGTFQIGYSIGDDGVTFDGEPQAVTLTTQVTPLKKSKRGWRRWKEIPAKERATWTTAYVNDLPDSSFAYIEPGGEKDDTGRTTPRSLRHFPHHADGGEADEAHVRNALARIPQSDVSDTAKSRALAHVKSHAKALGIETEDESGRSRATTTLEGDDMPQLDPAVLANIILTKMPAESRKAIADGYVTTGGDAGVTPDLVRAVAAQLVSRAAGTMSPDTQSQVQGILDKLQDAHDAHGEAISALQELVEMGAPEDASSELGTEGGEGMEGMAPGQAGALETATYNGTGKTPDNSGSSGTAPKNGIIGGRSIAAGQPDGGTGSMLISKVQAKLADVAKILADLLGQDTEDTENDVEALGANAELRPITEVMIGPGRANETDDEKRARYAAAVGDPEFRGRARLTLAKVMRAPELEPLRRVLTQAEDGRKYRTAMVAEMIQWGIRADGDGYNAKLHESIAPSLSIEQLEEVTRQNRDRAYKRFANNIPEEWTDHDLSGAIGRQTVPGTGATAAVAPGKQRQKGAGRTEAAAGDLDAFRTSPTEDGRVQISR